MIIIKNLATIESNGNIMRLLKLWWLLRIYIHSGREFWPVPLIMWSVNWCHHLTERISSARRGLTKSVAWEPFFKSVVARILRERVELYLDCESLRGGPRDRVLISRTGASRHLSLSLVSEIVLFGNSSVAELVLRKRDDSSPTTVMCENKTATC